MHSPQGELDILLALIARLREGQYFSVGRVERPDDTRVRDLARDKISRWRKGLGDAAGRDAGSV
jgi:hypothetical protein